MTQTPLPPPGWYPDPQPGAQQQNPERYWDGAAWTDHTRAAGATSGPSPYGPPQQPYGAAPAPRGNTLSIIGIVCGAIAFVFCPILLGPAGIVLGAVGRSKGESLGTVAIVVGAVGLVVGIVISFLIFQAVGPTGF